MTLGILGGVFDPPHNGHLALARGAIERFELDRLLVLVADRPGHRDVTLDGATRLRLARAAFGNLPGAEIALDEHPFTVDLVAGGGYRDAWFIVGADELAAFARWKEPQSVLDEVRLAVGTRPGYAPDRLEEAVEALGRPGRIELFELVPPVEVSASAVRQRLSREEPIDELVPPAVAGLIAELALYRP